MQILFVLLLVLTFPAFSQTPEDSVKKVITSFFTGMRNADTVHIRKALSPEVVFQTIKNKGVHSESVQEFLKSVPKIPVHSLKPISEILEPIRYVPLYF